MAFGKIVSILDNAGGDRSGVLMDIDTQKQYDFKDEPGINDCNKNDVVNYTEVNGVAARLTPNLNVRQVRLDTATPEVKAAWNSLLCAMAKDQNNTDVVCKKF